MHICQYLECYILIEEILFFLLLYLMESAKKLSFIRSLFLQGPQQSNSKVEVLQTFA